MCIIRKAKFFQKLTSNGKGSNPSPGLVLAPCSLASRAGSARTPHKPGNAFQRLFVNGKPLPEVFSGGRRRRVGGGRGRGAGRGSARS
jgi:hypothetical protein